MAGVVALGINTVTASGHDAHYATARQSSAAMHPRRQGCTTASTAKVKIQDSQAGWRYDGPTCRFTTSPKVGPRATVGTL
jgi:hypothetical protein